MDEPLVVLWAAYRYNDQGGPEGRGGREFGRPGVRPTGSSADREFGRPGVRPTGSSADREFGRPGGRPTGSSGDREIGRSGRRAGRWLGPEPGWRPNLCLLVRLRVEPGQRRGAKPRAGTDSASSPASPSPSTSAGCHLAGSETSWMNLWSCSAPPIGTTIKVA